jgi:hypothetical protein
MSKVNDPESFRNLENIARTVFATPKSEVERLEAEEKRKATERAEPKDKKPAE